MSERVINTKEHANGIFEIKFNRPKSLNALSAEFLEQLYETLIAARASYSIKAILLIGEGKAFCAGSDIHQLESLNGQSGAAFARHGQRIFDVLEKLGKPSLAAIHGFALGGGLELAMAATMRIAAKDTSFGQPEVKLGVIPGFGGTQRLARIIGKARALELCLTGNLIKSDIASSWGLVSQVVENESLYDVAIAKLSEIVKLPGSALSSIMTTINDGYNLSMQEALELEASHFGLCCTTRDKSEGVRAFLEKREASFVGE